MTAESGKAKVARGLAPKAEMKLGPYELGAVIYERDFLAAIEATHAVLGRKAIVRAVAPSIAPTDELLARLRAEAKIVAAAAGPGVPRVFEIADDASYFVLEHPRGPSLHTLFSGGAAPSPLTPGAAMSLARALVRAVATVHAKGWVLGSLDPAHAFVSATDRVVILAFDRVFERGSAQKPEEATAIDPSYASPEQIVGEPIDMTSDVFSLGIVCYELCAGEHPFAGASGADEGARRDIAHRIRRSKVRPMRPERRVPVDLERLLQRALGKLPAHRPSTATELLAEMDSIATPDSSDRDFERLAARLGLGPTQQEDPTKPTEATDAAIAATLGARRGLGGVAARLGAVFAVMVAAALAIDWAERDAGSNDETSNGRAHGFVRVLAHPWAEVWVDGSPVDTTPIGKPFELSAGKHTFVFKHPRAPDEQRNIDVAPAATSTLDVTMRIERPAVDAGDVDASP